MFIEFRRHSWRDSSGHLTVQGQKLCHLIRSSLHPPYSLYVSSPKDRCIETLSAFGFGVDIKEPAFGLISDDRLGNYNDEIRRIQEEMKCPLLEAYFILPETLAIFKDWAKQTVDAFWEFVHRQPDSARILIISHGGTIEPLTLYLTQSVFKLETIGGSLRECEGVGFIIENQRIVSWEVYRISKWVYEEACHG